MKLPPEPSASFEAAVAGFQKILDYRFRDPALLARALGAWNLPLTPDAAAARQRLEFLGDAAWDFAVATAVFQAWPQASVGDLTRFRATWCSTSGLADLARRIGLPRPDGPAAGTQDEAATTGARRAESPTAAAPSDRVLGEMLEAVLGAMVEDGGFDTVRALAHRVIGEEGIGAVPPPLDPKSSLQMLAQARFGTLPAYRLLERRGPPHHPTFRVAVRVHGEGEEVQAEAEGGSRQAAEQEAARMALQQLTARLES
jgi:ribonuclease-3